MTKQVRAGREGNGPFDSAQGPGRGSACHVCWADGPALDSFGYFSFKRKGTMKKREELDGFVLRHDAKRSWGQSPEKFVTYSPNKKRTDRMVSPL